MALRTSPDSGGTRLLPSVALLAAVTLPSGSRAIGSSAVLPEAKVAASWTFPHGTSLYTNVGVARAAASAPSARGWVSAAGWYAPGARLSLFTEFQATRAAYGAVPRSDYVDGGVTYLLNDRLQLDARIGRAAWSAAPAERYFGTGFSTRW